MRTKHINMWYSEDEINTLKHFCDEHNYKRQKIFQNGIECVKKNEYLIKIYLDKSLHASTEKTYTIRTNDDLYSDFIEIYKLFSKGTNVKSRLLTNKLLTARLILEIGFDALNLEMKNKK